MGLTVAELVATLGVDDMGFGSELDGLLGKFGPLQAGAVAAVAAIAAGFVAAGVAVIHFGGEFDEAFDNIRIQTGATGKELDGLTDDFKKVVSDVPTDFSSASTAIADLNTRLGITGKPLQDLSKQFLELSRLTGTDVAENIRAGTRLFGDWSVATEDQAGTLDQLFRASQQSGIGLGELMTTVVDNGATLRQLGFDLDSSLTMFAKFEKEGVNASKVIQGFGQLNKYATKEGRDGIDVWDETVKAIKNSSEAKAKAIGQEVFGVRAANDMVAAIREERFSYDDLKKSIKGGSDTIAKAAADTNDWRESLTVLKNKALVALEPVLSAAFGGLSKGVDAVGKALTSDKAKGIFDGIKDAAGVAVGKLGEAWQAVAPIIMPVLRELWQTAKPILSALLAAVVAFAKGAWTVIKWAWPMVKSVILGVLKVIAGIIRAVLAVIRGDWGTAWEAVKEIASGAWQAIKALIRLQIRALVAVLKAAWGLIKSGASAAWNGVKSVASAAWGAVKSATSAAWSAIVGAVISGVGRVVSFVAGLPGRILGALGSLGSLLYNAGVALIQGFISGITNKLSALWSTVSNMASKIKSTVTGALGIHSPSTVFQGFGQAVMAGLVNGISDGERDLSRKMAAVTQSISVSPGPRFSMSPAALAASGATGGQAPTVVHEHYHVHLPGGSVLVGTLEEAGRLLSPHVSRHQDNVASHKGRGR